MGLRVIVTRPAAQAAGWVERLHALGCEAVALPLIGIEPLADPAPLAAVWREALPQAALAMFVSANAVEQFFAARPAGAGWPAACDAGSTGPGTSAALRAAGVPAAQLVEPPADAPRFDSEALWARLAHRDWRGRRVLVVRGEDGRDWFAQTAAAAGAQVAFVTAYRRRPPQPTPAEAAVLACAQAAPQAHLWSFSSSEALGHLRALAPAADWAAARAVASHPRIAAAARAAGFGQVHEAPPDPSAVAALAAAYNAPQP